MVNSSPHPANDSDPIGVGIGKQVDGKDCKRGSESSPESKQDCHLDVKSSGLGTKRRFCCEHGHKTRPQKVHVACQTDDASTGSAGDGNTAVFGTKMSNAAFDSTVFNSPSEPTLSSASAIRVSAPQTSPKQDGEDGSKSEGTLRLMIHNFRNMNDTVRGPAKVVNGIPWKIMVMPRQHVVAKKGTQKCLGFFLQCFPESYSDSWSCQAAAELRLISQKQGVPNFVRKTNHVYTAKENDWGYSCFMTWADILDESQGYMKDENVILEVYVKAEAPKGILTHDQFCKKIQDYMRLADMQCSRNLIDKALEVNQTALKFCKDKDEAMKEELEKQRSHLIEHKLKQSIERIEKGYSDVKPAENGETTLRQAIAGNIAAIKNAGAASKLSSTSATIKEKPIAVPKYAKSEDGKTAQFPSSDEVKMNADAVDENSKSIGRGKERQRKKAQQVVDIFDPEASTSDDSEEESDYEDIEEVCDSCLVEKLENMTCGGGNGIGLGNDSLIAVETQENGCQTEPPIAKPRLPPIGATLEETKGIQIGKMDAAQPISQVDSKSNHPSQATNRGQGKSMTTSSTTTTTVALSNESEQKLLQLITEESKASLNTIKDTLERLVLLAQGGDSPLPNNVQFELDNAKGGATTTIMKQNLVAAGGEHVKTDVVEIPPPSLDSGGGGGKHQQDDSAKLVAMNNQLVAQKKRQKQEQLESVIAEELNESLLQDAIERQQQRQQQQCVQTDLSFTPRENSPTEDRTLLARAQAIVENKAEELVTKYSQLIEQSEANRLAETVKKVEKRMKDIEKQTMTCRKELSDECERHCREEQKLMKANKQLKQQLDQASEKIEKLNNQLKEKRMEMKKLEKKLKAECQSSAENAELNNKIEQLERDLTTCRQKHSEEKQRWTEETQKFHETKRSLQQELSFTNGEVERLHTQLEEKSVAIRKVETNLKQERQQAQSALKEASERAKKAEISLLEIRLETGMKSLQRALDECQSHVAQLEDAAKRFARMQMNEEARTSNSCLQEWRKTRDKIQELLQKAKHDFGQQIDAVKGGKTLASLPALDVPRPPPPPATPKLLLSVQTPPEQRQHIAPIGTAATAKGAGTATHLQQQQTASTPQPSQHPLNPSGGGPSVQRLPNVAPTSAACNGPLVNHSQSTPTAYHGTAITSTAAAPQTPNASGGSVTPHTNELPGATTSFEQTVFAQGGSLTTTSSCGVQPAVSSPSLASSIARDKMNTDGSGAPPGGSSDFTPWATDPLSIMHTLIGAKGGFNAFDHSSPASSSTAKAPSSSASGQGGNHELMNGGFGMAGGPSGGGTSTGRQGHDGQQQSQWSGPYQHQNWTQQSPAVRQSASNRSQGNNSPPQAYDGRSDSPSDKKLEALSEQLRNMFPSLSPDYLRECVYEFRHYAKNWKSMPLDQLLRAAGGFVYSHQQHLPKMQSNWNSNVSSMAPGGGGYDSSHAAPSNASPFLGDSSGDEACTICGYSLRLQSMCSLPSCSHVFHSACAAQWLLSQRACPTCGVFALPPEEYPDLS